MSAYLSLTAFVEIQSKCFGFGIKDAKAGLKLEGGLEVSCEISVQGELRFVIPFLVCIRSNLTFILQENPRNELFSSCSKHLEVKCHFQSIFLYTTDVRCQIDKFRGDI